MNSTTRTVYFFIILLLGFSCNKKPASISGPDVSINETFLQKHLSRSFNFGQKDCYQATLSTFKELGILVAQENQDKGIIISRRSLAMARVMSDGYSNHFGSAFFYPNAFAPNTSSYSYSSSQRRDQFHKYYFKIQGDQNTCTIKAFNYKVWINQRPIAKIRVDWPKENIWDPFFATVLEQLQDQKLTQ